MGWGSGKEGGCRNGVGMRGKGVEGGQERGQRMERSSQMADRYKTGGGGGLMEEWMEG